MLTVIAKQVTADNSTNNNISCDISHISNISSSEDDNNSSNSNSSDAINNCSDNSNNDTSCAASCSGVDNDISSGDIISNCVVSDNTTDITMLWLWKTLLGNCKRSRCPRPLQ